MREAEWCKVRAPTRGGKVFTTHLQTGLQVLLFEQLFEGFGFRYRR